MILIGFNWLVFIFGICFYCFFLYNSMIGRTDEDKQHDIEIGEEDEEEESHQPLWKGIGFLIIGGFLIIVFSGPFISAVTGIASSLKINPILLAFFLAPVASEGINSSVLF